MEDYRLHLHKFIDIPRDREEDQKRKTGGWGRRNHTKHKEGSETSKRKKNSVQRFECINLGKKGKRGDF